MRDRNLENLSSGSKFALSATCKLQNIVSKQSRFMAALTSTLRAFVLCSQNITTDAQTQQKRELTEWQQDDAKVASIIACTLNKSVAELMLTCTSAKDIWDKLCVQFERSITQWLNMLIESFFQAQCNCKEDISTHVAKLQKLFVDLNDELAKHNENTLSERMLTGRILSTQPGYWSTLKSSLARLPHCGPHKPTVARSPETAAVPNPKNPAAAPPTTLKQPTASAGTTGVSGMKPENAPHHAPTSRGTSDSRGTHANTEIPASRKTAPEDVNGS
jgi:hypothetical protein